MAELEFDPPSTATAPAGGGERTLEFDAPTREQEIRRETLKKLMEARGPGSPPGMPYLDRAVDQYTLGMARPLKGLSTAVEGKANEWFNDGKPATIGEYFRGGAGAQKDYFDAAVKDTPGPKGVAADAMGAVAGSPGNVGGKVLGKVGQAGQAFVQGAISGASRNTEDAASATKGAVAGGGTDAGVSYVLNALMGRLGSVANAVKELGVASRQGGSKTLKKEGGAIFDRLDEAGVHFSGKETPELANKANTVLANSAYSRNVPVEIDKVTKDLNERVGTGAMTYGDVRKIETQLSDLKAHPDAGTRSMAKELGDAVTNFMQTAKPTMPASSVGTVGPDDLATAKKLWTDSKLAGKMEGLAQVGTRRSSDPTAKVAKNFESYTDQFVRNPDKYRPGTPEQHGLMDKIVEGSPKTEAVGKYADYGAKALGGLGAAGAVGGALGPYFGAEGTDRAYGPSTALLAAAGGLKGISAAARSAAAQRQAAQVNDLIRNIVTGQTAPQPGANVPRDLLAKVMAWQARARAGGNYASSFVDTGGPQP